MSDSISTSIASNSESDLGEIIYIGKFCVIPANGLNVSGVYIHQRTISVTQGFNSNRFKPMVTGELTRENVYSESESVP